MAARELPPIIEPARVTVAEAINNLINFRIAFSLLNATSPLLRLADHRGIEVKLMYFLLLFIGRPMRHSTCRDARAARDERLNLN